MRRVATGSFIVPIDRKTTRTEYAVRYRCQIDSVTHGVVYDLLPSDLLHHLSAPPLLEVSGLKNCIGHDATAGCSLDGQRNAFACLQLGPLALIPH